MRSIAGALFKNSDELLRMMQKADRFVHFPPPRGAVLFSITLGRWLLCYTSPSLLACLSGGLFSP